MSEPQLPREVHRRLTIIRHAEEVTGNMAMTCRYQPTSVLRWLRRYHEQGIDETFPLEWTPTNSSTILQYHCSTGLLHFT
jgi:hypothetical protein